MSGRTRFAAGLVLALAFFMQPFSFQNAQAYTFSTLSDGTPVRWRPGQKFFLAGNPSNPSGISAQRFFDLVIYALQQWRTASNYGIDFDYWQGTDRKTYPTSIASDGKNAIFFASQSQNSVDPNVIGYTQVWYNQNSGDIMETDLILNDRNFRFTLNESDTTSRSGGYSAQPQVYLGSILTHELGHALGLSHSGSINASMLYVETLDQGKLGCDDVTGIRHLYSASQFAEVTGTLLGPSRSPIQGAVVTAISKARGIAMGSAHTDANGRFQISGLESGTYSLFIDSFKGGSGSVPARVQARQDATCGNPSPQMFTDGSGRIKEITLQAGVRQDAGSSILICGSQAQESENFIFDGGNTGTARTYTFKANGRFRATLLNFSLLSKVVAELRATETSTGRDVQVSKTPRIYRSNSGFELKDSAIEGVAYGDVQITVQVTGLSEEGFPTPSLNPASTPFFILGFENEVESLNRLPANTTGSARCSQPETFPLYQSPEGDPATTGGSQTVREAAGFCGTAHADPITGKARPLSTGTKIGWILPYFLLFLGHALFRRLSFQR